MMRWIVIDGIDGSGKSTYARWVKEHYESLGETVLVRIHPSERFLGSLTRRTLQGKGRVLHLLSSIFFIGDVLSSLRYLRKDGQRYGTVIYIRYLMATAYLPERYIQLGYDFFAKFLPVPKRLLLVDIDPLVAMKRIEKRNEAKEMFEDLESLRKTRAKVLRLAGNGWTVIENNVDVNEMPPRLINIIEDWDARFA
jgi:dTMP kinase